MISTYLELKDNIIKYGKRKDALNMLDTFIQLAEVDIDDALKLKSQDIMAESTTSTVDRFHSLPDDYLQMRRLRLFVDPAQLEEPGRYIDLKYVDPISLRLIQSPSVPYQFTTHDQIEFNCVPDAEYKIQMSYFRELVPLSADNPTNSVLTQYPMIYLSGCLRHFYIWAKNTMDAGLQDGIFEQSISRANRTARRQRYGPNPASTIQGMVV